MDYIATYDDSGITVNDFLRKKHGFSRRIISRIKFENGIEVNKTPVFTNYILKNGDVVSIRFSNKKSEYVKGEDIPLDVIYEDDWMLAVNKPAGMPSHPSIGHPSGTLANAVAGYFEKNKLDTAVRILGRLDMDTSGVVIICKNQLMHKLFTETDITKEYIALCSGVPMPEKGKITEPIIRFGTNLKREVHPSGKFAETIYETLETRGKYSLVRLRLVTGRTHQIRVHLSHIGCPIAGDFLYGGENVISRQALHAESVSFIHPISGKSCCVQAPLAEDIRLLWEKL